MYNKQRVARSLQWGLLGRSASVAPSVRKFCIFLTKTT